MEVLDKSGKPVPNVYCIGDANGETLTQATGHCCSHMEGSCCQACLQLVLWEPSPKRLCAILALVVRWKPKACSVSAGKYMLAHAASAQGISAVENMCGRKHTLNHLSVPAACFTHPEVSFVGLTEEAAREQAEKDGYKDKVAVTKTSFKANSKVGRGLTLTSN